MPDTKKPDPKVVEAARNATSPMMDALNCHSASPKVIAGSLADYHPSLQQRFGQVIVQFLILKAEAYDRDHYDQRDEGLCRWAYDLMEHDLLEPNLPCL